MRNVYWPGLSDEFERISWRRPTNITRRANEIISPVATNQPNHHLSRQLAPRSNYDFMANEGARDQQKCLHRSMGRTRFWSTRCRKLISKEVRNIDRQLFSFCFSKQIPHLSARCQFSWTGTETSEEKSGCFLTCWQTRKSSPESKRTSLLLLLLQRNVAQRGVMFCVLLRSLDDVLLMNRMGTAPISGLVGQGVVMPWRMYIVYNVQWKQIGLRNRANSTVCAITLSAIPFVVGCSCTCALMRKWFP